MAATAGCAGPARPAGERAFEVATTAACSVHDGLYVALAALLAIPLVTADRRLHAAIASGPLAETALWVADVPEAGPSST